MPFYKKNEDSIMNGGTRLAGPNGLDLSEETKDQFTYPQQGWYWFDTFDDAIAHFSGSIKINTNNKYITKYAFRNRFTLEEKTGFDIKQIDNPNGTVEERYVSASIRVWNADVFSAKYIDLDLKELIDGLNFLQSIGLLSSERVQEILTAPIQPHERYVETAN